MGTMATSDFVALIHLVGFLTGVALYGMLAAMTWPRSRGDAGTHPGHIPVLAAVLGLIWNAGALLVFGWRDFGLGELSPWLTAISYAALGFLPAVVVDSATRAPQSGARPAPIAIGAYILSAAAALIQADATAVRGAVSSTALLTLTLGYAAILLALAVTSHRRTGSQRALTAVALAAFAVSALHQSHHSSANDSSWIVELIGHHASLPLVLVILYQDYRFALADLFLKRALAGLSLVAIVVACYALLDPISITASSLPVGMPVVWLTAWIGTALLYPSLRRGVDRFVDRVVLRRGDYRALRSEIATTLARAESPDGALDLACERLRVALTANRVEWTEYESDGAPRNAGALVALDGAAAATVAIPTADTPGFTVTVQGLANGRRLLSDDVALLENVALLIARRVDELRVARERLERDVRESEMQRLAAEAELRALRAQLNPHFLFNALTTIGYLIRTSPPRAIDTLYQLTALLRAVLRRSTGEFVTLNDELQIVDAYLAIEQARYEDRLRVERVIPAALNELLIPPLLLQPVVENAIKHGISARRLGGVVRIEAFLESTASGAHQARLRLRVSDTGPGVGPDELARRRAMGLGLSNIERRLQRYFGTTGRLAIESTPGVGTHVELWVPVSPRIEVPPDTRALDDHAGADVASASVAGAHA
jgi:two-component system LytT family sensor kinase